MAEAWRTHATGPFLVVLVDAVVLALDHPAVGEAADLLGVTPRRR